MFKNTEIRSGRNTDKLIMRFLIYIAPLIAFLVAYVNSVLLVLNTEITGDETLYLYFAKYLVNGGAFFGEQWFDDKPGGAQLIYLIANLFNLPDLNIESTRVFSCIFNGVTYISFFILLRMLIGSVPVSFLGSALYIIISTSSMLEGSYSNADNFVSLGIILAAITSLRGRFYLAGFIIGIFFCIKQNIALEVIPSALLLYIQSIRGNTGVAKYITAIRFNILQFMVFLLPLSILLLFAYISGTLEHFLKASFLDRIHSHITYKNYDFAMRYGIPIINGSYFYWLSAILFIITFPFIYRSNINSDISSRDEALYIFVWILCSALGVWVGGYFFPHYFLEIIPVLVVSTLYVLFKSNLSVFSVFVISVLIYERYFKVTSDWLFFTAAIVIYLLIVFVPHRRVFFKSLLLLLLATSLFSYSDLTRWRYPKKANDTSVSNLYKASHYVSELKPRSLFVYDYVMEIYSLSGIHPVQAFPAKFQYINHNLFIGDNRNYPNDQNLIDSRWLEIIGAVNKSQYDVIVINYGTVNKAEFVQLNQLLNSICSNYAVDRIFGDVWVYKISSGANCNVPDDFVSDLIITPDDLGAHFSIPFSQAPFPYFYVRCPDGRWAFPINGIDQPLMVHYTGSRAFYKINRDPRYLRNCSYKFYDIMSGKYIQNTFSEQIVDKKTK